MKTVIVAILTLSMLGCVETKPWTKTELTMAAWAAVATAVDMSQTFQIKDHPGMSELNPVIGPHPSDTTIAIWFPLTAAVGSVIAHYGPNAKVWLPVSWQTNYEEYFRTVFLGGWAINETAYGIHNMRLPDSLYPFNIGR
jgi:hypothetical protein